MILTVYCLAYNHEKYIRKTLEGFVNQKTSYEFKVIVHDDASTDKTKDIIAEFQKKYPKIFYPIYQKKNQFSKGVNIFDIFIKPHIDTKYTAICEGDDYWCDENKIQQQIDYLEAHADCSLCVHNTLLINESGNSLHKKINNLATSTNFNTVDIITNRYFHTSSYIYRTELVNVFPKEFRIKNVGDYPLSIYLSLHGYVHYIDKVMSCYRVGSINSWTQRTMKNKEKAIAHNNDVILALKRINLYTDYKFNNAIERQIIYYKYNNLLYERKYWKIFVNQKMVVLFLKKHIPQFIKNKIKSYIFAQRVKNE